MIFPVPLAPLKIDLERQVWLSRLVSACLPVSILDAYDHFYAPTGPKRFTRTIDEIDLYQRFSYRIR